MEPTLSPRARTLFLVGLAAVAVLGLTAVLLATRPQPAPVATPAGPSRTVSYTSGGTPGRVVGQPATGDPTAGARFFIGQADAPLTIVEFANYQCPYCRLFEEETQGKLFSEFVDSGKVRFAYRDFLVADNPPAHERAASAVRCAADQDEAKFADFHDLLFRAQSDWGSLRDADLDARLIDYAGQLGLDGAAIGACLKSEKYLQAVRDDNATGLRLGVTSTPTFFVGGYRYEGALPIEAFRAIIASAAR